MNWNIAKRSRNRYEHIILVILTVAVLIWTIINIAAWVLCAVFLYLILSDLIKVEKGNREEKKLEKKD